MFTPLEWIGVFATIGFLWVLAELYFFTGANDYAFPQRKATRLPQKKKAKNLPEVEARARDESNPEEKE